MASDRSVKGGLERVVVYIDGFNLYYGLRTVGLHTSRWLDLVAMSEKLIRPNQRLSLVRYFTARVSGSRGERQRVYLDALYARGGIEIDYGVIARHGSKWEEKQTDSNIVRRVIEDAFDNRFEVAIIISGDSDLVPAIMHIKDRHPNKQAVVVFPPSRKSSHLGAVANGSYPIGKNLIRSCRLPNPVEDMEGRKLWAPKGWLPSVITPN